MTAYLSLALWFVGIAAALAALLTLLSGRRRRAHVGAMALTALALFVLTAAFDNLMIGAGLFHYDATQLLGVSVGLAPVEDFAYPLAGALLLPALWEFLRSRRARAEEESA